MENENDHSQILMQWEITQTKEKQIGRTIFIPIILALFLYLIAFFSFITNNWSKDFLNKIFVMEMVFLGLIPLGIMGSGFIKQLKAAKSKFTELYLLTLHGIKIRSHLGKESFYTWDAFKGFTVSSGLVSNISYSWSWFRGVVPISIEQGINFYLVYRETDARFLLPGITLRAEKDKAKQIYEILNRFLPEISIP
jgi:hypothetical protein